MNISDSYQFEQVVVNGKKYTSDVTIFPIGLEVIGGERQLCLDDIAEVIAEKS